MHRVINMTSVGINSEQITIYKEEIRQKLTEYSLADSQVNDGRNEDGNPTLGINADFNAASEANDFHGWLKVYVTERREQFKNARTRVHDCFHAADQNQPCMIGDIWELQDGAE